MSAVDTGMMTVAEFMDLPNPPSGQYYELHHGQAVLMTRPKLRHSLIQNQLLLLLLSAAKGRCFVTLELPYRPIAENEVWTADVAVVSFQHLRQNTSDFLTGPPELVIEVLSPSNTMDEMLDKQELCLANGCRSFWIVDPKRQRLLVTGPDRRTITYTREMECPLPEPLEGTLAVGDIYATA